VRIPQFATYGRYSSYCAVHAYVAIGRKSMKHVRTLALATAAVVASALVSGMAGAPTAAATAAARPIEAGAPAGMWQPLSADPLPFYPQATMVLTDGSVMLQEVTSDVWWRLRPDARGNYLHGTYTRTPPMPGGYAPTYECRAVLPDGRLLIIGGEYQGTGTVPVESNQGAVYDPVANSWQPLAAPPGVSHIGDSSCTMMPNGRLLLASRSGGNVFELDPASMTWTAHTPLGKLNGTNSEENWTLLPDGTIFTVDVARAGNAERYIPPWLDHSTDGRWVSAGAVPAQTEVGFEMGPAVLRPDGSVLALGANGQNAIYRPPASLYGTGTWTTAEPFADSAGTSYGMADGTASLLPDGSVVALASPGVYQRPTMEFRIAGADTAPLDPSCRQRQFTSQLLLDPQRATAERSGPGDADRRPRRTSPLCVWSTVDPLGGVREDVWVLRASGRRPTRPRLDPGCVPGRSRPWTDPARRSQRDRLFAAKPRGRHPGVPPTTTHHRRTLRWTDPASVGLTRRDHAAAGLLEQHRRPEGRLHRRLRS
jgi:hypothetical protein